MKNFHWSRIFMVMVLIGMLGGCGGSSPGSSEIISVDPVLLQGTWSGSYVQRINNAAAQSGTLSITIDQNLNVTGYITVAEMVNKPVKGVIAQNRIYITYSGNIEYAAGGPIRMENGHLIGELVVNDFHAQDKPIGLSAFDLVKQ